MSSLGSERRTFHLVGDGWSAAIVCLSIVLVTCSCIQVSIPAVSVTTPITRLSRLCRRSGSPRMGSEFQGGHEWTFRRQISYSEFSVAETLFSQWPSISPPQPSQTSPQPQQQQQSSQQHLQHSAEEEAEDSFSLSPEVASIRHSDMAGSGMAYLERGRS